MINNDKYALIKEYTQSYNTMTEAQADDWTQRLLKLDANVAGLRQKYWINFRKVLPAKEDSPLRTGGASGAATDRRATGLRDSAGPAIAKAQHILPRSGLFGPGIALLSEVRRNALCYPEPGHYSISRCTGRHLLVDLSFYLLLIFLRL